MISFHVFRMMGIPTELIVGSVNVEQYVCAICLDVWYEPRRMSACVHVFCWDCVLRFYRSLIRQGRTPVCPLCRTEFRSDTLRRVTPALGLLVARLWRRCHNHGCNEVYRIHNTRNHERSCRFAVVTCRWDNCGAAVPRHSILAHLALHMSVPLL